MPVPSQPEGSAASAPNGRWLITGGCGFIGTALIRRLLAGSATPAIRVFDNLSVGSREDLEPLGEFREVEPGRDPGSPVGLELLVGDIRDPEACRRAVSGCDIVVHLAANTGVPQSVEDPLLDFESNVSGTFSLLMAAREADLRAFVFASSGAPLGEVEPPIHEELAAHPFSPYGASKLAGEGYCSAFYRTFGVPTVCLRFGNVYGPGSTRKSSVVAKFIRQALAGNPCEIYGDGSQTRDFVFIEDLIEAIRAAASQAPAGEIFQIASGREHTVLELANELKAELERNGISMNLIHGSERLGDVRRNYSDTTKAEELLEWSSRTELKDGLAKTVEFFVD